MFEPLKMRVKDKAERTAIGLVGGLLMLVGLGFLTAAAWMAISLAADPLMASLIIGGAYFGLGLIFIGAAKLKRRHYVAPTQSAYQAADTAAGQASEAGANPSSSGSVAPMLVAAFMEGFGAGMATRRRP
ncbi:phage holin family protein [Rhodalgimonas zhirmunskyi]|uniref:Phage holin family protein n=1 Tax=Rhodalgimonas zhirmunskyi TaxID=2964767 RepID=A0AAJ1UCG5_9RHOB|nr:phage holin family protein [Rhodoalgimonas zhirmunskyi]MDQ2094968.1 phage holin family protein [Rhodoalgimonas zhirmunskyi]